MLSCPTINCKDIHLYIVVTASKLLIALAATAVTQNWSPMFYHTLARVMHAGAIIIAIVHIDWAILLICHSCFAGDQSILILI